MNHDLSLHQRRRAPTSEELKGIPWLAQLQPAARTRAVASLLVGDALPGDFVCRVGRPVTYWFGVVEEGAAAAESLKDQAGRLTQMVHTFRLTREHTQARAWEAPTPAALAGQTPANQRIALHRS